jgi:hypothetical protein
MSLHWSMLPFRQKLFNLVTFRSFRDHILTQNRLIFLSLLLKQFPKDAFLVLPPIHLSKSDRLLSLILGSLVLIDSLKVRKQLLHDFVIWHQFRLSFGWLLVFVGGICCRGTILFIEVDRSAPSHKHFGLIHAKNVKIYNNEEKFVFAVWT